MNAIEISRLPSSCYLLIPHIVASEDRNKWDMERIIAAYLINNNLTKEQITKRNRRHDILRHRQALCYLIRTITGAQLKLIADYFGQDHTTVIHSITTVQNDYDTSQQYRTWLLKVDPTKKLK